MLKDSEETMMKMGNIKYIHMDKQLKVERRHYWPIFLAKDAEDLREQKNTRKILREYAIFDDEEGQESLTPTGSEKQGADGSDSMSLSKTSKDSPGRKSPSRVKEKRTGNETPKVIRDFSPNALQEKMSSSEISPKRISTGTPAQKIEIMQGNLADSPNVQRKNQDLDKSQVIDSSPEMIEGLLNVPATRKSELARRMREEKNLSKTQVVSGSSHVVDSSDPQGLLLSAGK